MQIYNIRITQLTTDPLFYNTANIIAIVFCIQLLSIFTLILTLPHQRPSESPLITAKFRSYNGTKIVHSV
jgi:hypothetical protein